jgi:hypothetical protein
MADMTNEVAARLEPSQQYAIFVVAMNEYPNFFPPNTVMLYDSRRKEDPVWGPYIEEFVVLAVVRDQDTDYFRTLFPFKKKMKPAAPAQ